MNGTIQSNRKELPTTSTYPPLHNGLPNTACLDLLENVHEYLSVLSDHGEIKEIVSVPSPLF